MIDFFQPFVLNPKRSTNKNTKDQLESKYEQRLMADGKFNVDDFIGAQGEAGRSVHADSQVRREVRSCWSLLCEEANEALAPGEPQEPEGVQRLRGQDLRQSINVDAAVFAQLMDKTCGRSRVYSHIEATAARRDMLELAGR